MRQYLGSVINQKGHDFAKSVAEEFRQHGWQACNEVQMSEMGAPPEDADGDIDVLAWKESEILLIECKRLQLARTVAEVGKVCERFSGEAKDELAKHIRRVNWLKNNPRALSNRLSFEPQVGKIDSRLITNTHVPMMYLSDLPYSAAKIGPLGWVGDQPLSRRP